MPATRRGFWPLLLFVLMLPPSAQGDEACYNNNWRYHKESHACFRQFYIRKTWTEAKDYCAARTAGISYGVVSRLAKIDDRATNNFIRTLFPTNRPGYKGWIGMHKTDKGTFRWLGYPNEIPKFNATTWQDDTKPNVAIYKNGWRGYDEDREHNDFVCYHGAKKIGSITCQQRQEVNRVILTCTSNESPIKGNCQSTYKYEGGSYPEFTKIDNPSYTGNDPYRTTCSVVLSNLNPGNVKVKLKMYPAVSGIDLSNNEKAATYKWKDIPVVKPQKAKFNVANKDVNGPTISLVEGTKDVFINCIIDTGSPDVSSTTMTCDNTITMSSTPQEALTTTIYSALIGEVKRNMDGRKCTCWGNHVTGRTEDSILTLRIIIKPQKAKFEVANKDVNGPTTALVQGTEGVHIKCIIDTGSPDVSSITMTCDGPITSSLTQEALTTTIYSALIGEVKRDMDGRKCTCWGNHVTGRTEDSILTLRVITKPTGVTCQTVLNPNSLLVSCHVGKVFPEALCAFKYHNEGNGIFQPVSPGGNIDYFNVSYTDSDGLLYYETNCSTTFTPNMIIFNPGELTVYVTVNPNSEGLDKDTTSDAFVSETLFIEIAVPDKPQFQRLDKSFDSSYPLDLNQNDTIDLRCHIRSGHPLVYSVTLSCDFPINDSDQDYQHTVSGTHYVIQQIASRDMDGKSCTCIGNHLTGLILSSPLTFNVIYPSEVTHFTVNGNESLVEVEVNETLALSCQADGNPTPAVHIRKLESSYLDTSTWQSDQSDSQVNITIVAQCNHNGQYRCSTANSVNSQEETQNLDIRVRCPPTYCNESSQNIQMSVQPGTYQTVSLCLVAYPMPILTLWKNSNSGLKQIDSFPVDITQKTNFDSQRLVDIQIPFVDSFHLGKYSFIYTVGEETVTLSFQMIAPLSHCTGEDSVEHKVKLGRAVTLDLCVTAFPSPSRLAIQFAHGSSWQDITGAEVSTTLNDEFDTLTQVTVDFSELKATDMGNYRLYDPTIDELAGTYLAFSLSESPSDESSENVGPIVGAVVAIVIVLIIVVIIIFFVRRHRKNRQKESTLGGGPVDNKTYSGDYSQVDLSSKKKRESKEKPSYGAEDYAHVNVSKKNEHANNKEKDDTHIQVYDNDTFVPEQDNDPHQEEDTERTYSNVNTTVRNPPSEPKCPETKASPRGDDLVYIQLDFNYKTDTPTKSKKSKKSSKAKSKKAVAKEEEEEEEGGPTEYAQINATATVLIKMEKDKKEEEERRKNEEGEYENRGEEGGEEEIVYENVQTQDNVP